MINNRISLKENQINIDSQKIIKELQTQYQNIKTPINQNKPQFPNINNSQIKIEVPKIETKIKLLNTFGKKTLNKNSKKSNLNDSSESFDEEYDYLKFNLHKNLESKPSSPSKINHEFLPEKYKNNEKYKINLFKYLRNPSISNNKSLSCKYALYKKKCEKFDGNITKNNLNEYFIIYVLSTFLGNVSLWLYLPKYINKQKIRDLNIKKHIKPTLMLFIPQIATQIYTVLDKTMIGTIISDKSEVGYYEQAQKMIKLLLTLATSLGTVMMPRIAATYAEGNNEKIKNYMKTSFSFILMLTFPLMFGMISISSHFVPIFYGKGYDKVVVLICAISPILILIGLSNVIGTQYLLPTKQQNKYTISVIIGAVVNFVFNFMLIKKLASVGASIATVLAELSVTVTQFILVKDQIRFVDVIKISYKYIVASIIMFIFSIIIGNLIDNNLISIIVQIIISGFIYFGLLILLRAPMVNGEINKFLKKKNIKK